MTEVVPELQLHLEQSLQRSIDAVLRTDEDVEAARVLARSPAFSVVSPSLSVWLNSCLTSPHQNENRISLEYWSDLDLSAGLGACLALRRFALTQPVAVMCESLLDCFAHATANRLTLRELRSLGVSSAAPKTGDPCSRKVCPGTLVVYCTKKVADGKIRQKFYRCNRCGTTADKCSADRIDSDE